MIAQQLGSLTDGDTSSDRDQSRILDVQSREAVESAFPVDSKCAAAYRVGLELSRLRFFAIQAFLLDRRDVIERTVSPSGLVVAVLGAIDDPIVQDRSRAWVMEAFGALQSVLERGDHLDELAMAQGDLLKCIEGPQTIETTCREICESLELVPVSIVEDLRSQVDLQLALPERLLMRLGEFVAQLAYPATIGREMLEDAVRLAISLENARPRFLDWAALSELRSMTLPDFSGVWPTSPYDCSKRSPAATWGELHFRWHTAGLDPAMVPDVLQNLSAANESAQDMSSHVAAIHNRALTLLNAMSDRPLPTGTIPNESNPNCVTSDARIPKSCGESPAEVASNSIEPDDQGDGPHDYFGLRLDAETFTATRLNRPSVDFRARVSLFNLFRVLLQNGERLTTREMLQRLWDRIGRADNPEKSTIDDAISRLRKSIHRLGIDVKCDKKRGWRLNELRPK